MNSTKYDDILQGYINTDNTELELRTNVDSDTFCDILENNRNTPKIIEKSVNIIADNSNKFNKSNKYSKSATSAVSNKFNKSTIITLLFDDKNNKKEIYQEKTRLYVIKNRKSNITLSREIIYENTSDIDRIKKDINISKKLYRIKLRYSFRNKNNGLHNWRIDCTVVCSLNNHTLKDVRQYKNELFSVSDIKNVPRHLKAKYEVELEHMDRKNATIDDINNAIKYMSSFDHYNHNDNHNQNNHNQNNHNDNNNQNNRNDNNYQNNRNDNNNYQNNEYNKILRLINTNINSSKRYNNLVSIKNMVNKTHSLTRVKYDTEKLSNNMDKYILLDKADGDRTLVVLNDDNIYIVNNTLTKYKLDIINKLTILDCEYISETKKSYVFDVLMFDGKSITHLDTKSRMGYIDDIVKKNKDHLVSKKYFILTNDNYRKTIIDLTSSKNSNYETDGFILTPIDSMYYKTISLKWKPSNQLTIDFLVKNVSSIISKDEIKDICNTFSVKNTNKYDIYYLFNGINNRLFHNKNIIMVKNYTKLFPNNIHRSNYFPIQFSPTYFPMAYIYLHPKKEESIDGKVCEMLSTHKKGIPWWKIIKIRHDREKDLKSGRYFGNDFNIAESTYMESLNPLTIEDITSDSNNSGYFQETKGEIYKNSINFHNFIKTNLMKKYISNHKYVIDLACGKGQDIYRHVSNNNKNIIFMDKDIQALITLLDRKRGMENKQKLPIIYTSLNDINTSYKKTLKNVEQLVGDTKMDAVICNFALHYMAGSDAKLKNFVNLVDNLTGDKCVVLIMGFDGNKIFNLLKDKKKHEVREGPVVKYRLTKKYKNKTLTKSGQKISVKVPFSTSDYDEYLVNIEYLCSLFEKKGFDIGEVTSFNDMLNIYKNEKPLKYNKLYQHDKDYSSLNSFIILQKGYDKSEKSDKSDKSYEIYNKIANNNKHLSSIIKNAIDDTKLYDPIERFDQLEHKLEYREKNGYIKFGFHNGQRKLFLNELQFLTRIRDEKKIKYVIYAGSSPGHKTHYLKSLFPDLIFILIDPNKFDLKIYINNKTISHRNIKHKDIVHIKSGYTIKCNEMPEGYDIIDFIKQDEYKIYIIEDYMDSDYARLFSKLGDVAFISDIRSDIYSNGEPTDLDISWNNAMMLIWMDIMNPCLSMIKYRHQYGGDNTDLEVKKIRDEIDGIYKTINRDFAETAKIYKVDLLDDYKRSRSRFSKCEIFIQPWPGITSTEVRLIVNRENIHNLEYIDGDDMEQKLFYYNIVERSLVMHKNNNSDKKINFCLCNDCALENLIWKKYGLDGKELLEHVSHLGYITHRPLYKTHKFSYFDKITLEDLKKKILITENISQNKKNYGKALGNKGTKNR